MITRHKHADVIHAYAEGAKIRWRANSREDWEITNNHPSFYPEFEYEVVPEPKQWFEEIPEHGVLCWVFDWEGDVLDSKSNRRLSLITEFHPDSKYQFVQQNGTHWKFAVPLTNEEIKKFMTLEKE